MEERNAPSKSTPSLFGRSNDETSPDQNHILASLEGRTARRAATKTPVSRRYVWGATVLSSVLTAVAVGSLSNYGRVDAESGDRLQPEPLASTAIDNLQSTALATAAPPITQVEREVSPRVEAPAKIESGRGADAPIVANAPKRVSSEPSASGSRVASTWQNGDVDNARDAAVVARRVSATERPSVTKLTWSPRKAQPASVSTWRDADMELIAALIQHQEHAPGDPAAAWSPSPVSTPAKQAGSSWEPAPGQSWNGSDNQAEWSAPANDTNPNASWSAPSNSGPNATPNATWTAPTCRPDAWGNCSQANTPAAGDAKD